MMCKCLHDQLLKIHSKMCDFALIPLKFHVRYNGLRTSLLKIQVILSLICSLLKSNLHVSL